MKGRLTFNRVEDEVDEIVLDVMNEKNELLGQIYYTKAWHCFIFEPESNTFFDKDCLKEVSKKLHELDNTNTNHRLPTKKWRI